MDNRHRELEGLLHMWKLGTRGRRMTMGERKDSERKNNYLRGRKGTMGERGDSKVDNIWYPRRRFLKCAKTMLVALYAGFISF